MDRLLLIIISIFLPPLAVLLKKGLGKDFLINLVLSLIFLVPGIIHALWVVTNPDY
ncbi:YqaE/Pmp3 family membrane protein [Aliidiomarina taiwanensis]|uniref:YqaE/Pmp3 family membrane protein n=2 Tax=Aliidiomarina taiwanensis TaxID=946228 RepID=A0A432XAL7_9GAMM|nr:YqaE/Pmp3 family membrane protein [Aliidiomarina taiwanensis]RUO44462.1 YqaE/Pmp3 family membrane protein [Aliidiomarina taiwanensis]